MSTGPVRFSSWLDRLQQAALAAALLAWIGGCTDDSNSDVLGPPFLTPSSFVVSDPVAGPAPAGGVGAAGQAGARSDATVVYVSLEEGEIPLGTSASIRNWRTGATLTTTMVAGGFDPVAVEAVVGDTLEVAIDVSSGPSPLSFILVVPLMAPPIVVRTEPANGKRDVPLNARIVIVFSEPIDGTTLTGTTIRLKQGSADVDGAVQFVDAEQLTAEFVPDEALTPGTDYVLVVTQGIEDLDGDALKAPATVTFTTGEGPTQLAFVRAGQIYVVNSDGSGLVRVSGGPGDAYPAWSPDGQRIAFISERGGSSDIYIMNADGSNVVRRTTVGRVYNAPSWSPDGTRIVYATDGLYVMSADDDGSGAIGILDRPAGVQDPAWSPDGAEIAFVSGEDTASIDFVYNVYVTTPTGAPPVQVTSKTGFPPVHHFQPAWSPDGERIAVVTCAKTPNLDCAMNTFAVAIMSADGTGLTQLVTTNGFGKPAWSPDGRTIMFSSIEGPDFNQANLHWIRADGSAQGLLIADGHSGAWRP